MTELEQGLDILDAIQRLLAEVPGTLKDHQMRINSMEFLRDKLKELDKLKNTTTPEEV